MWQHFQHRADIGIRGIGDTREQAFEEAAAALMQVIGAPEQVHPEDIVEIHCEADDIDLLFCDWINALIFEMDVRKMLFGSFQVRIENGRLSGRARGQRFDPNRHDIAVEVKAATFMELKVYENDAHRWIAQCVVDV